MSNFLGDRPSSKALFLDRDGVVNKDFGYVHTVEKLEFVDGIFELCAVAKKLNFKIVIITNQSGIARGYYTEEIFLDFMDKLISRFADRNIVIDGFYYCPHLPEEIQDAKQEKCLCRKPSPGMLFQAFRDHNIDPKQSILVGDQISDIQAGISAGIQKLFLLSSFDCSQKDPKYCLVNRLDYVSQQLTDLDIQTIDDKSKRA